MPVVASSCCNGWGLFMLTSKCHRNTPEMRPQQIVSSAYVQMPSMLTQYDTCAGTRFEYRPPMRNCYGSPAFIFGRVPNMTQLEATPEVYRAFMDRQHCTLEVRTGAGKTAAYIAAGMAALDALPPGTRLVLTSRTWAQVTRLYSEMRMLHPLTDTILLGSRENLCLDYGIASAGQDASDKCLAKCDKAVGRGCPYRDRAANLSSVVLAASSGGITSVRDVEDLVAVAAQERCCTYYGGGEAVDSARKQKRSCVIVATTTLVLNDNIAAAHNLKFGARAHPDPQACHR